MSDPCAVCHRPIPEDECRRMIALGMVVHTSLLQCGEQPVPDYERENHSLHRVLLDLIAELRAAHRPAADLDGELRLCAEGCGIMPCPTLRYADRAAVSATPCGANVSAKLHASSASHRPSTSGAMDGSATRYTGC